MREWWERMRLQAFEKQVEKYMPAARSLVALGNRVPSAPIPSAPVWKRDPLLEATRRIQQEQAEA